MRGQSCGEAGEHDVVSSIQFAQTGEAMRLGEAHGISRSGVVRNGMLTYTSATGSSAGVVGLAGGVADIAEENGGNDYKVMGVNLCFFDAASDSIASTHSCCQARWSGSARSRTSACSY